MHSKGRISYAVRQEHFRGMMCLLQIGEKGAELGPFQAVDSRAITRALVWLKANNVPYEEYFAFGETLPGYFPQGKVSGANTSLPLKSPDITTWGGRQISLVEMANKTGLFCSVDDL